VLLRHIYSLGESEGLKEGGWREKEERGQREREEDGTKRRKS